MQPVKCGIEQHSFVSPKDHYSTKFEFYKPRDIYIFENVTNSL